MRTKAGWSRGFGVAAILSGMFFMGCGGENDPDDTVPDGGDTDTDTDSDTDVDAGADSGTDSDSDSDSDCPGIKLPYEVEASSLLVLLDRSHSMFSSTIGDVTHAELVEMSLAAFAAEQDELGAVELGLAVFPSMSCPTDGAADAGVDELQRGS